MAYLVVSPQDKTLVILSGDIKTPPLSAAARVEAGHLVVDVFAKKTRATPKQVIERCKQRLRVWDRDDERS